MLERSKVCCHVVGQSTHSLNCFDPVVQLCPDLRIFLADRPSRVATGVAYKIGTSTPAQIDLGYRVLLGMFGAVTVVTTIPYMIIMKHRPGQQLPLNTSWWLVGPK